ncbi:MAG TPA: T9SS type A sorting domain-containing protein [Flavobacteriales bacterium]|nr:T9SS type A sorting domain-containing protein [Flavobacteriales bacterium]HMR28285.1 T9SS type A sorting domain-containing protein [Flavobacteriales bacterium]
MQWRTGALPPLLFAGVIGNAQDPVWSPDVANIIYTRCTSCHHDGGIGPFPLMSYSDVVDNGNVVAQAVTSRHMPPWPADPAYRHFAGENVLTQAEIDAVVDWVAFGAPFGDPLLEPDPPVFAPGGSLLDTIHHVVAIEPYTLQYSSDEYRWFAIPTNFPDTVYVNGIEVMPGLDAIVHHADISYDATGASAALDAQDPLPGFNSSTGSPTYSYYMNAWQPGGNPLRYPPDWGIPIPPGADLVIEIHYGPGGAGLTDSTVMNLRFATGSGPVRPVHVGWTLNDSPPVLIDGPLEIPANTVRTFHQVRTLPNDRSYLSICPHMHRLGKSYKVWAVIPGGDTIPLVDIPQWNFHWQMYYTFQHVQVLPAGTVLMSEGVYDNTIFNPDNPNNPPQNVYRGPTTEDEMFLCYFIWADHRPGDEHILMDSTLLVGTGDRMAAPSGPTVFPNPTSGMVHITFPTGSPAPTGLRVMDACGRLVRSTTLRTGSGELVLRVDLGDLPPGLYVLELSRERQRWLERVVRW